jgi:hypothetical protein
LFDQCSHVAQTAFALWIADVAGASPGADADQNEFKRGVRLSANIANRIPKAVTNERVRLGGVLLKYTLAQIRFRKTLGAIGAVIYRGATGCATKEIFGSCQLRG